jgi:hypothetical protein
MSGDEVTQTALNLSRLFADGSEDLTDQQALSLEELRRYVAENVSRLLDRNPSMLMSILYRVDVSERDVKHAFSETDPNQLPLVLADLLIERQIFKMKIRQAYSSDDV